MYVQLGEDQSGEVNVVELVNEELKERFSSRNIEMRTKTNSEYVISYTVISYVTEAEDFTADEEVRQFSIKVKAQFILKDKKGKVISDEVIEGSSLYEDDKDEGKDDAVKDLIAKYITKIDNNW